MKLGHIIGSLAGSISILALAVQSSFAAGKYQCPNDYQTLSDFCQYRIPQEKAIHQQNYMDWVMLRDGGRKDLIILNCDRFATIEDCRRHYSEQGYMFNDRANMLNFGPMHEFTSEGRLKLGSIVDRAELENYLWNEGDKLRKIQDRSHRFFNFQASESDKEIKEWEDADYRCCTVKLNNMRHGRTRSGESNSGLGRYYDNTTPAEPFRPQGCTPRRSITENSTRDYQWIQQCETWRKWYWDNQRR